MLHVRLEMSRSFIRCLNSFRSGHPKRHGARPEIRENPVRSEEHGVLELEGSL